MKKSPDKNKIKREKPRMEGWRAERRKERQDQHTKQERIFLDKNKKSLYNVFVFQERFILKDLNRRRRINLCYYL